MDERHGAPSGVRPSLIRARLLHVLDQRWRKRLITVTAGPGFGKTTLLSQAVAENTRQPAGIDSYLACRPADSDAEHLAQGLLQSLAANLGVTGATGPSGDPLPTIIEVIIGASPRHVAMLVDDAQYIGFDTDGSGLLQRLVDELPSNGHLVLAGRPDPVVRTARLMALGEAAALGAADLAFDDEELRGFATLRLCDRANLVSAGGWPALAELLALAGPAGVGRAGDFLWDELLELLPESRRRELATLEAVGRCTDRRLSAALGYEVPIGDVVRNLPMAQLSSDGLAQLHPLWGPALRRVLTASERRACRVRAAADALATDDLDGAFDLFADARAWDDARAVVRQAALLSYPLVPDTVLRAWHRRLASATLGDTAEAKLLQGMILRTTASGDAASYLFAAAESFRALGDRDNEATCLFQLGQIYWWRNDTGSLAMLVGRLVELAAHGAWLAASVLELAPLLAAPPSADSGSAEAAPPHSRTLALHPEVVPLRNWILARNALHRGDAADALLAAESAAAAATPAMAPISGFLARQCLWAAGHRTQALGGIDSELDAVAAVGLAHFTAADLAMASIWMRLVGRRGVAEQYLSRARATVQNVSVWAAVLVDIAGVIAALDEGDEHSATALLAETLRRSPLKDESADLAHRPWLAVSYVLDPSTRTHWDAISVTGSLELARRCARAIVALREDSVTEPLRLSEPDSVLLESVLLEPWRAEAAVALVVHGGALRAAMTASFVHASAQTRQRLRTIADERGAAVRKVAGDLLGAIGRVPTSPVSLGVLGPLRISIGGVDRWPAELNRHRVRELLLLLVERGALTRDQIVSTMWPDQDERSARANLRTTLSYLNAALEPDRPSSEVPYFVGERGDQLYLVVGAHLTIDVRRFEETAAEARALDRDGFASRAAHRYTDAVLLYRGDYLADLGLAEWTLRSRDRLRVLLVSCAVRAGELLVSKGTADAAIVMAERAIEAEPWSEPAHRVLAEGRMALGDLAGARRAYDACVAAAAELGAAPTAETAMLGRRLGA